MLCVSCTFEFLISAFPHPKSTTLGISLGGQPVKHQHSLRVYIQTILDQLPGHPYQIRRLPREYVSVSLKKADESEFLFLT
jgi:hypothetical protein